MTFDLRIRFIGLAMFVPEGNKAMHVLLPSTTNHVHAPGHDHPHPDTEPAGKQKQVEPHFARIVYDTAYEQPNRTELARGYRFVDLERRVLDLRGISKAGGLNPALPHELPSMSLVAEPVERRLVTELPDASLAGRVTMDSGVLTHYSLGALFRLNGSNPQRMALETEWTIRGIELPFLPGRTLPGGQDGEEVALPDLHPIGETIHLMVFHTVAKMFPPKGAGFRVGKPPLSDQSDHFAAYYGVSRKREEVPAAGSTPVAVDPEDVLVTGMIVKPVGKQTPSLRCVQAQGVLGA